MHPKFVTVRLLLQEDNISPWFTFEVIIRSAQKSGNQQWRDKCSLWTTVLVYKNTWNVMAQQQSGCAADSTFYFSNVIPILYYCSDFHLFNIQNIHHFSHLKNPQNKHKLFSTWVLLGTTALAPVCLLYSTHTICNAPANVNRDTQERWSLSALKQFIESKKKYGQLQETAQGGSAQTRPGVCVCV